MKTIIDPDALKRQIKAESKPEELGGAADKVGTSTVEGLTPLVEIPFDPNRNPLQDQLQRITDIVHELKRLNSVSADSPAFAEAQEQRRTLRQELEHMISDPQLDAGVKYRAEIEQASMYLARNLFVLAEGQNFTFDSVEALTKIMQAELEKMNEKFGPGVRPATMYAHKSMLEFHATIGGTPSEVQLVRVNSRLKGALFSGFELRVQPSEWAPVKAAIDAEMIKEQESSMRKQITRWINLALDNMVEDHPGKWREKELGGVQENIQTRVEKFLRAASIVGIPSEAHVTRSIPVASGWLGLGKRSGTIDITVTKECQVIVTIFPVSAV